MGHQVDTGLREQRLVVQQDEKAIMEQPSTTNWQEVYHAALEK